MDGNQAIEKLLADVYKKIQIHEEEANAKGEKFNIFSILRMKRAEVQTHSRFLYELLNPKGSHGKGNTFLRLFINQIITGEEENRTFVFDQISVKRIDLTIESKNYIIGIELKIDAVDQNRQLLDYYKELKARAKGKLNKNIKLYYLTLNGKRPSKDRIGELNENDYGIISFENDIIKWLNGCIEASKEKPVLAQAINQYKILIESITGMRPKMSEGIAEILIESKENLLAAKEISGGGFKAAKVSIQTKFWEKVIDVLKSSSYEDQGFEDFKFYPKNDISKNVNYYYDQKDKSISLTFTNKCLKQKKLCFCIRLSSAIYYGLKSADGNFTERLISLENLGDTAVAYDNKEKEWAICFYGYNKMETINFRKFNEEAISFVDNVKLENSVSRIVNHLIEIAYHSTPFS